MTKFDSLDTQVLGISVDSIPCHQAWQKSLGGINFPLLSDFFPQGAVSRRYGVLTKSGYADRVVFIINKQGILKDIDWAGEKNLPDIERSFRCLEKIK